MEDWERLGRYVRAARSRRWRVRGDFAAACGVSVRTLSDLEHGRRESYDPYTLAAVEAALGWQPSSIQTVLRGGDPTPEQDEDLTRLLAAWSELTPEVRQLLADLAEKQRER